MVTKLIDYKQIIPVPWQYIILHHTWVPNGRDSKGELIYSKHWSEGIDRVHRKVNKWEHGLGYHFVIEVDGTVYMSKRWLNQLPGAHTVGRNHDGIGIAMVGDFDKYYPTLKQYISLFNVVKRLSVVYMLMPSNIHPHRQYANKTCPGTNLNDKFLKEFREVIAFDQFWSIGWDYSG